MHIGLLITFALFALDVTHREMYRAAPSVIVLGGGPLPQRIALTDFPENQRLISAAGPCSFRAADSVGNRPRIAVVMYWGLEWKARPNLPDSVSTLARMEGAQAGSYYPRFRGQSAVWVFGAMGTTPSRRCGLSNDGVRILVRHGVPSSIE